MTTAIAKDVELTARETAQLRRLVEEHGLDEAARQIGCSREPLARALAGLQVRRGTLALVRSQLTSAGAAA